MKKILAVCGDSYMAAVQTPTDCHGEHFTELLANKLNMELFTLARGGCSNNLIRLQIEEVVKQSPSLVIIGTTTRDRLEIPVKNRTYDYKQGILNFDYSSLPDLSKTFKNFTNEKINLLSLTISNLFNKQALNVFKNNFSFYDDILDDNIIEIMKLYFSYCYDSNWKEQLDSWIISDGLELLNYHKIPFYILPDNLKITNIEKFKKNIIENNSNLHPSIYSGNTVCRFHTTTESQHILADLWFNKIKEDKFYE